MCGIAGLLSRHGSNLEIIDRMADCLAHRGPDDRGVWVDRDAGLALGHRRLAIIDLSPNGHQPMTSADGRWVIVFNGEIYNHHGLRSDLANRGLVPEAGWRGASDIESFLEFVARRGLDAALKQSVGMFAFALWDRSSRELFLARDRFGEKPLYYGWVGGDFAFASELKALVEHPEFTGELCPDAVESYIARTYVPGPLSIYTGIFSLPPGSVIRILPRAVDAPRRAPPRMDRSEGGVRLWRYWTYESVVEQGLARPYRSESDALEALADSLGQAIRDQSIADVPVGVFLSGGIDSATVTALYQKYSSTPVRSFTIGFEQEGFDEAHHARKVASYLGTDHHEYYLSAKEALDIVPSIPGMFDEPFADSSQIPTYLVSRFARDQVTVALSGDGGDELFCGYSRYGDAVRLWNSLRRLPYPVRRAMAAPLMMIPPRAWHRLSMLMNVPGHRRLGSRIQKAIRIAANSASFEDVYVSLLHQWPFELPPIGGDERLAGRPFDLGGHWPDAVRAMYCDVMAYLPDDILRKVDRASMAVSLETRAPFLDHRVASVAARVPMSSKRQGTQGKLILRSLLGRELPAHLFERPKSGFALPLGDWLRGPLREWAQDLLNENDLRDDGWFDPAIVHRRWTQHLNRERDSGEAIWAVLMFQSWRRERRSRTARAAPPARHSRRA